MKSALLHRQARLRAGLLWAALAVAAALVLGACQAEVGTATPETALRTPRTPLPQASPTPAPVGPILAGFIPLRQGIGANPTDMALDAKHHRLYVLCAEEVDIVDTRTLRVTRVLTPRDTRILGLDSDAQQVLLGGAGGSGPAALYVLDGERGVIARTVSLAAPPWRTVFLPAYNLAVAALASGEVAAVNVDTGLMVVVRAGGSRPLMEADADAGKVYLSGAKGPQGQEIANALSVLDARTGRVDIVPLQAAPTAFAVDGRTHRLFILHQYQAAMTVYAPDSGILGVYDLGGEPVEMALDSSTSALYISDWRQARLLMADTRRPASPTALDIFPSAHFLQAQASARRLIVAQAGGTQAALVDRGRVVLLDLPGAPGVAVIHPATGVSYVAIPGANLVLALAPDGAEFLRWTVPSRPEAMALDSGQDRLFVSLPGSGAVAVIDLTARTQDLIPHALVPSAAVVHPADGQVYLADPVGATVYVFSLQREQAVRAIAVGPRPAALAVDRATGEVWASCADGVYVAAAGSRTASRVVEWAGAPMLGVDSALNQVYVGLPGPQSSVQVLEGAGHRLLKVVSGGRLVALDVDETAGLLLTVWQSLATPGTLTLSLLDGRSLEESRLQIALPIRADERVAAHADGTRGVAVLAHGGRVVVVDLSAQQARLYAEIPIPEDIPNEYAPFTVVGDRTSGKTFVGVYGDRRLLLLDSRSRVSDTVSLGAGVATLALDEPRGRVYAALLDGTVAVVDGATGDVLSQVAAGGPSHLLVADAARQRVFACSSQQATVYAIQDATTEPTPEPTALPLPTTSPTTTLAAWTTYASGDEARAFLSDGRYVWVATTGGVVRWNAADETFRQFLAPQDGLRSDNVYALGLGADGGIWAATAAGLSRYGGAGWSTQSGLTRRDIRAVAVAPDGRIWAGGQDGVLYVSRPDGEEASDFQEAFRLGQPISEVALDAEGRRWVASRLGVTVLSDGGVITYTAQNSGLPPGMVNALLVLTDGAVLAATDTGLARFQNGVWTAYPPDSGAPGAAMALAQTADGALWAASPLGIYRYEGAWSRVGTVREAAAQYAALWKQPTVRSKRWPILAAGGKIWAILDGGLANFDGQMWTRRSTTGVAPPSNRVRALAIGPDGALWAGFTGSPAARYDAGHWTTFPGREQAPANVNAILADPGGRIWFAADDGVALYDGQRWTRFKSGEGGLATGRALSLAWDAAGALWVGTEDGLSVRRKDSWASYAPGANGPAGGWVRDVAVDGEGVLWCATNRGVSRYDGKSWQTFTDSAMPPAEQEIWGLALDDGGARWFGARRAVRRFVAEGWFNYRHLPEAVGYDYARILRTLNNPNRLWAVDAASGRVWIGVEGGVAAYDGHNWQVYTPENSGLASARVRAILPDGRGAVWFATDAGISRFAP